MIVRRHRASREVPGRDQGRDRRASARCRRISPTSWSATERFEVVRQRHRRRRAIHSRPGARRGVGMTRRNDDTAPPACASSPIAWQGVETASLGVQVGVGSRHESEAENGLSHLIEHMAFKGTRRAQRARHRRRDRIGRRRSQRRYRERAHRLLRRACCRRTSGLALDILADILHEFAVRPGRAGARKAASSCRRSARSRTRPTISCSNCSIPRPFPTSRSAAPFSARPRQRAILRSPVDPRLSRPLLRRQRPDRLGGRGCRSRRNRRSRGTAVRGAAAGRADPDHVPARYVGGERKVEEERRAGQSRRRLRERRPSRSATITPRTSFRARSAAAWPRACSRKSAKSAGSPIRSTRSTGRYADTGVFGFHAAASPRDVGELMKVALDCIVELRSTISTRPS